MAPETGIRTIHRRKLETVLAEQGPEAHAALVAELTAEWISEAEPWEAAAHLSLDDVVEPGRTREVVAASIDIALGGLSLGGAL
jgi:acetyl-CoA carboxylase carboxyltransferase component